MLLYSEFEGCWSVDFVDGFFSFGMMGLVEKVSVSLMLGLCVLDQLIGTANKIVFNEYSCCLVSES